VGTTELIPDEGALLTTSTLRKVPVVRRSHQLDLFKSKNFGTSLGISRLKGEE